MSSPAELELRWAALPGPPGQTLEAERLGDWAGGPILLAVDVDRRRHLLVAMPPGTDLRPQHLKGLSVTTRRLRAAGNERTWADLVLADPADIHAFAVLCTEIHDAALAATDADPGALSAVLSRWRRFWAVSNDELGREAQLGLFGELWLLTQRLPTVTAAAVNHWRGPLGGRHDFVSDTVSVEVKTTGTASGPVTHRVTSLEQLADPEQGSLYLLSLRVVADPLGGHSLDGLLKHARDAATAAGRSVADDLDNRLAALGWSPAHADRYNEPARVMDEHLYDIRADFPRLTRTSFPDGIPSGVTDISYILDTSACRPWLVHDENNPHGRLAELA